MRSVNKTVGITSAWDVPPSNLLYNAAIYKLKILPCLPETQPATKAVADSQKENRIGMSNTRVGSGSLRFLGSWRTNSTLCT